MTGFEVEFSEVEKVPAFFGYADLLLLFGNSALNWKDLETVKVSLRGNGLGKCGA